MKSVLQKIFEFYLYFDILWKIQRWILCVKLVTLPQKKKKKKIMKFVFIS